MRKLYILSMLALASAFSARSYGQATIAQWNFNGNSATEIPGGNLAPTVSSGAGTASVVGTLTTLFNTGNSTTGTLETATTTNFAWQSTDYAAPGTDNKGRGLQFNVSTVDQTGITFKYEQRLSNKAGNTYVVQYTADVTATTPVWIDAQTFTFTPAATGTGDTWYNTDVRTVDLTAITDLDDNPNVAFRIVAAFDPTTGNYLSARSTSTYDGTGTVRLDMVTVNSATTLGVPQNELAKNEFTISPNPSNGYVNFNKAFDITVMDISGKIVLSQKNAASLNTSDLHSGVYFVKTSTGATKKLMVN